MVQAEDRGGGAPRRRFLVEVVAEAEHQEVLVEVVRQLIFGLCLRVPTKGGSFPKPEPSNSTE